VDERRHRWSREIKKEKNMATKEGGRGGEMVALREGEDGRKERAKSLPPPLERATQRRWGSLTKDVEKPEKKGNFSQKSYLMHYI
jgi:hypothetical protein